MTFILTKPFKAFLPVLVILLSCFAANAQDLQKTNLDKSRITVVKSHNRTNIWVKGFPKKTSVVILDEELNLLAVISTNNSGAAYLSLPQNIKGVITAKTVNGEILVTNKEVIKSVSNYDNMAIRNITHSNNI